MMRKEVGVGSEDKVTYFAFFLVSYVGIRGCTLGLAFRLVSFSVSFFLVQLLGSHFIIGHRSWDLLSDKQTG